MEDFPFLVEGDLNDVNTIIHEALQSPIELIEVISKHILYAKGKRIRPLLSLVCAKIFSPTLPMTSKYLAAAVEFIHTATLLHDDVVDDSVIRRGTQAAHKIWGNSASILVGDYLFARAFELMVKTNSLKVLNILSSTSAKMASGEVLQLTHSHNLEMDDSIALEIIGSKTAELFGAACQTGALVGGGGETQAHLLYEYGYALGMTFQMIDDILDYTATSDLGKNIRDDFNERKVTLPLLYTYKSASLEDKNKIQTLFSQTDYGEEDFKTVSTLMHTYKGIERAQSKAKEFSEIALKKLHLLPSRFKKTLEEFVTFSLNRQI